jgi:hypothetical protein
MAAAIANGYAADEGRGLFPGLGTDSRARGMASSRTLSSDAHR